MFGSIGVKSRQFLDHNSDGSPLLVALSGGPDSLLLYEITKRWCQEKGIELQVAHIDHGCRRESGVEAQKLKEKVVKDGVGFHLSTASFKPFTEEKGREHRMAFFSELAARFGFQAVLMGHHADDQAEVVLKRVFEGASFDRLSAMEEVSSWKNLLIWRPLLSFRKKEIEKAARALEPFIDPSNVSGENLRGKMRQTLIPMLSKHFGKEITSPLLRLAEEAKELRSFLEEEVGKSTAGAMGVRWRPEEGAHPYLIRWGVKYFLRERGEVISYEQLDRLVEGLVEGHANKRVGKVIVDRGELWLPKVELELPQEGLELKEGKHEWGPWTIRVEKGESRRVNTGVDAVWQGGCCVSLPEGQYELRVPRSKDAHIAQSSLDKWWTRHKVPAFLRYQVPVLFCGNRVTFEFLSGKTISAPSSLPAYINLYLNFAL